MFAGPIACFCFVFFLGAVVAGMEVRPALLVVVLREVRHGRVAKVDNLDVALVRLHEHRFLFPSGCYPLDLARAVQCDLAASPFSLCH